MKAVISGDIESIRLAIKNGANVNAYLDGYAGGAVLDVAIETKQKKIVELLIDTYKADVNTKSPLIQCGGDHVDTPLDFVINQRDYAKSNMSGENTHAVTYANEYRYYSEMFDYLNMKGAKTAKELMKK